MIAAGQLQNLLLSNITQVVAVSHSIFDSSSESSQNMRCPAFHIPSRGPRLLFVLRGCDFASCPVAEPLIA
jgi:hypothetical protein